MCVHCVWCTLEFRFGVSIMTIVCVRGGIKCWFFMVLLLVCFEFFYVNRRHVIDRLR